ncbi:MAG: endonuclease domain-containing protein [Rickettsiales bacterium]
MINKIIKNCSPLEGERASKEQSDAARRGGYGPVLTRYARRMRQAPTPWEQALWNRLKANQLGAKFRRQQPIGSYIVDFMCAEARLIVELDGSQHVDSTTDTARDAFLTRAGYRVLRFWNNDVDTNIEGVLSQILAWVETPPHEFASANSAPPRGGSSMDTL